LLEYLKYRHTAFLAAAQQGRDIQEFLVQYVATFVPAASGENFNPHVTTGAGPQTTWTR